MRNESGKSGGMGWHGMVLLMVTLCAAGSAAPARAQQGQIPGALPPPQTVPGLPPVNEQEKSPEMQRIEAEMAKKRNTLRQKELVADTDKLLKLATELKAEVDKTNKNVMSVDVIRKADQIEKLAKSVKQKMKAE